MISTNFKGALRVKQFIKSKVMKTMKFRLLATMITLAAVIIATSNPVSAQRRSTSSERRQTERVQKSNNSGKKSVEKRSTTRRNESRSNSSAKTIRQSNQVKNYPAPLATQKRNKTSAKTTRTAIDNRSGRTESGTVNQNRTNDKIESKPQVNRKSNENSSGSAVNSRSESTNRRNQSNADATVNRSTNVDRTDRGSRADNNLNRNSSEKYRLDENDRRYTPNREYRGGNSYWSGRDRPDRMNYNHNDKKFYRKYNYNSYKHWDKSWENYRWNFNSWRDYYSGYNPYAYRYYKYYYHHPFYGDVIRRFINPPLIFVNNNIRYYCYDGHFFRYHAGIGYILVDMPYGMVFDYIPVNYEPVYINGYLYYRVGNLFFEYDNFGFHLIHYPERYFSVNVSFSNNGFNF